MSFLCYNDISAMSRLHRSASAQMSRPAISIQNSGGWTFGSPQLTRYLVDNVLPGSADEAAGLAAAPGARTARRAG